MINRRKIIQYILHNFEVAEFPSISNIFQQYLKPAPPPTNLNLCRPLRIANIDFDSSLIESSEVKWALKKARNSAPVEDGIQYSDLLLVYSDGIILAELYNQIVIQNIVPEEWKHFKTILIPKPEKLGQYADIVNWRSIALLATSYKFS